MKNRLLRRQICSTILHAAVFGLLLCSSVAAASEGTGAYLEKVLVRALLLALLFGTFTGVLAATFRGGSRGALIVVSSFCAIGAYVYLLFAMGVTASGVLALWTFFVAYLFVIGLSYFVVRLLSGLVRKDETKI